jgi:hypothetical protein
MVTENTLRRTILMISGMISGRLRGPSEPRPLLVDDAR